MAYSELIKNFNRVRDYMREFYIYGFKSRDEFNKKSARSYDDERRRLESWLGEYMRFRHENDGKVVFMSIDSRQLTSNPLYKAFKTKSFTNNDITLHFCILDLLQYGKEYSATDIIKLIGTEDLSHFDNAVYCDESTIRKKLKEYVALGLISERKHGKEMLFFRAESTFDPESWSDALSFFSEYDPAGVIGSYIRDITKTECCPFRFKHRYLFHALDSQVMYTLTKAISEVKNIRAEVRSKKDSSLRDILIHPLRIYLSTNNGRQYLLGYNKESERIHFVRLDNIAGLSITDKEPLHEVYLMEYEKIRQNIWGVSLGEINSLEKVKMTIHIEENEEYIYQRLMREKRCGTVTRKDTNTCIFSAEVYDAMELLPWIRTFTGRIENFYCSNPQVTERLNSDIEKLEEFYGGCCDDIQ